MKTSLLVLVASSFLVLSCGNTKKKNQENSGTPGEADGKPSDPIVASSEVLSSSKYKPVLGDYNEFQWRQKAWSSSDVAEIGFWNVADATYSADVVKIYDVENRTAIRKNIKLIYDYRNRRPGNSRDIGSMQDSGVNDAGVCGSSTCSESEVPERDFGIFIGAKGIKSVCKLASCLTAVSTGVTSKTITRTETVTFRHSRALNPDFVVSKVISTCTLKVDGKASLVDVDPCKRSYGSSPRAALTRSNYELQEQKAGTPSEKKKYQRVPFSKFSYSPVLDGVTVTGFAPAVCTKSGEELSISLSRNICGQTWSGTETVNMTKILPAKGVIVIATDRLTLGTRAKAKEVPLDQQMCLVGPTSFAPITHRNLTGINCKVSLKGDRGENILYGSGSCDQELQVKGSSAIKLNDFEFSCDAPDSFDFDVFN